MPGARPESQAAGKYAVPEKRQAAVATVDLNVVFQFQRQFRRQKTADCAEVDLQRLADVHDGVVQYAFREGCRADDPFLRIVDGEEMVVADIHIVGQQLVAQCLQVRVKLRPVGNDCPVLI